MLHEKEDMETYLIFVEDLGVLFLLDPRRQDVIWHIDTVVEVAHPELPR